MTRCSWRRCPTCGRNWGPPQFGPYKLTYLESVVFEAVATSGKRGIPSPDLLKKIYADRKDGGPLFARDCMYVTIHRLNAKIAGSGKRVERKTKSGVTGIYVLREKAS